MVRDAVPGATIAFVKNIAEDAQVFLADQLYPLVCKEIDKKWPKPEQRAIFTGQLRLRTEAEIREAVYVYCQSINWKDVLVDAAAVKDIPEGVVKEINAISWREQAFTKEDLFFAVCDHLEKLDILTEKSKSKKEKQIQIALRTTSDVRYAIDLYFVYKQYGYYLTPPNDPPKRRRSKTAN